MQVVQPQKESAVLYLWNYYADDSCEVNFAWWRIGRCCPGLQYAQTAWCAASSQNCSEIAMCIASFLYLLTQRIDHVKSIIFVFLLFDSKLPKTWPLNLINESLFSFTTTTSYSVVYYIAEIQRQQSFQYNLNLSALLSPIVVWLQFVRAVCHGR